MIQNNQHNPFLKALVKTSNLHSSPSIPDDSWPRWPRNPERFETLRLYVFKADVKIIVTGGRVTSFQRMQRKELVPGCWKPVVFLETVIQRGNEAAVQLHRGRPRCGNRCACEAPASPRRSCCVAILYPLHRGIQMPWWKQLNIAKPKTKFIFNIKVMTLPHVSAQMTSQPVQLSLWAQSLHGLWLIRLTSFSSPWFASKGVPSMTVSSSAASQLKCGVT